MTISQNRAKVTAAGVAADADFALGPAVESFTDLPNGAIRYTALSTDTGKWEVGEGTVTGFNLSRDTIEETSEGNTDKIDFTGETLYIAQTNTVAAMNMITDKLDTIESGATADMTGAEIKVVYETEADTNAFDDAAKTKLQNIESGATADQTASEVPVTPTLTLLSSDVQNALEELDGEINNHSQPATTIVYDSVNDLNTTEVDIQLAMEDHADQTATNVGSMNGVITGGRITGSIGSTTFNVEAGEGILLDSVTDVNRKGIIRQLWNAFNGIAILDKINSLNVARIQVYIESNGGVAAIYTETGPYNPIAMRDYVYLGSVGVINGVISSITLSPSIAKQTATDLYDLYNKSYTLSGGAVTGLDGSLGFWQQAGTVHYPGVNWFDTNGKDPNNLDFEETSAEPRQALQFVTLLQNGVLDPAKITVLPNSYDVSGVITPIPTGKHTVHYLYQVGIDNSSKEFILLHGQYLYDTASEAQNQIGQDVFILPEETNNAYLVAFIGVSDVALNFADPAEAWILQRLDASVAGGGVGNGSGVTNHYQLTNIGMNTHTQIDTHIADAFKHTGIHFGDNPPLDKIASPIWFNTSDGTTLTWYDDGNTGQWVQDIPTGVGSGTFASGIFHTINEDNSYLITKNVLNDISVALDTVNIACLRQGDMAHLTGRIDITGFSAALPTNADTTINFDLATRALAEDWFSSIDEVSYGTATAEFFNATSRTPISGVQLTATPTGLIFYMGEPSNTNQGGFTATDLRLQFSVLVKVS